MTGESDPSKGDEYHHPDGTVEIVFAIEDDQVLTVREYQAADFAETVRKATHQGVNEMVAELPPAELYRSQDLVNDSTKGQRDPSLDGSK